MAHHSSLCRCAGQGQRNNVLGLNQIRAGLLLPLLFLSLSLSVFLSLSVYLCISSFPSFCLFPCSFFSFCLSPLSLSLFVSLLSVAPFLSRSLSLRGFAALSIS